MSRATANGTLLRELQLARQREYAEGLISEWDRTIPDEYNGHDIQEAIGPEEWGGRLTNRLKLRRYLFGEGEKFLLATGDTGIGKSTLVCTIARYLIEKHQVRGEYISAPRLMNMFSFFQNEDPVGYYSRVPILVVDDIMAVSEKITSTQKLAFWTLVDQRWGKKGLYTLMTTNASINSTSEGIGLSQYLGETGWDRISHQLTWIQMTGESFRRA